MKIRIDKRFINIISIWSLILFATISGINFLWVIAFGIFCAELVFNLHRPDELILLQVVYVSIFQYLISYFQAPTLLSYITDIINIILLIHLILDHKLLGFINRKRRICIWIFVIVICSLFAYVMYGFNLLLCLWGFRNMYRFLPFMLATITYGNKNICKRLFSIVDILLVINLFLVYFQSSIKGYWQDNIGGCFGVAVGTANTYLNVYLIVASSIYVSKYIASEVRLKGLLWRMVAFLYIATVSELKVYYIELILIFVLTYIFNETNKKKLLRLFANGGLILIGVSIAIKILYTIYPTFRNFYSVSSIYNTAINGYTSSDDIGRLSVIPYVFKKIMNKNSYQLLFGIGIGNAQYSNVSILCSNFYSQFWKTHYNWFSDALIVIESGLIGLAAYCLFWLSILLDIFKKKKNTDKIAFVISEILIVLVFLLIIYNTTMNIECVYFLIPFVLMAYMYNRI